MAEPTTQEIIDAKPGTLLTPKEIGKVKDIIQDQTYPATKQLCDALQLKSEDASTPLAETDQIMLKLTRFDLDVFINEYGYGTVAAKGGREGDDYDKVRDKEEVRQTLRLRLGLPAVSQTILVATEVPRKRYVSSTTRNNR